MLYVTVPVTDKWTDLERLPYPAKLALAAMVTVILKNFVEYSPQHLAHAYVT
jgi:hypothetical protein